MNSSPTDESPDAPTVSVVLCSYNRPTLLRLALESVLAQTYQDFEIVLADDASDFDVGALAASFADPRIHVHRSPRNLGIAGNYFRGFRIARGTYIGHLDDDDMWEPQLLELLVSALEAHHSAGIAFGNHSIMDADCIIDTKATVRNQERWGRAVLKLGLQPRPLDVAMLKQSIPSDSALFRRSTLDLTDLPSEIRVTPDLWIQYIAARECEHVFFTPEVISRYRVHSQQYTSLSPRLEAYEDLIYCYERILAGNDEIDRNEVTNRLATVQANYVIALLRHARARDARVVALRSVRTHPTLRGALALLLTAIPRSAAQRVTRLAAIVKAGGGRQRLSRRKYTRP